MHSSNTGTTNIIANLFSTLLVNKLGLDMMYFGMIFGLAVACIEYLTNQDFNIKSINMQCLAIGGFLLILVIWLVKNRSTIIEFVYGRRYYTIKIYNTGEIVGFLKYMKYFPQYFSKHSRVNFGDIDERNSETYPIAFRHRSFPDYDHVIKCDDKNIGFKGYATFKKVSSEVTEGIDNNKKTVQVNSRYVEFHIFKSSFGLKDIHEFSNRLSEEARSKEENDCLFSYIKVLGKNKDNSIVKYCITKETHGLTTLEERERMLIGSFFNKEKDLLWNYIKNIEFSPELFIQKGQSPQTNILLHGPPGTGKSTFAYRIARTLNKNLVSMDLRQLPKDEIYNHICGNAYSSSRIFYNIDSSILVFDEFDLTVDFLVEKEKIRNMIMEKIMQCPNGSESITETSTNTKKTDKIDDNKTKLSELNSTIKDIESEMRLKDLLEIFQGSVPFKKRIIIATTNNYERINKLCPELFRPGRLTPIYFGYLDRDLLQELSLFYFDRKLSIKLPKTIEIPTSEITEMAMKAIAVNNADKEKAFKFFHKFLVQKFN